MHLRKGLGLLGGAPEICLFWVSGALLRWWDLAFVWTRRGGDVTVVPAGSLDSPVSKRFIRVDTEGVFMLSFPNFLFILKKKIETIYSVS